MGPETNATRNNLKVHIAERHSPEALITVGDWDKTEGFGLNVTRTPLNAYCGDGSIEADHPYTQSNELGCFWQENQSSNFCWVDASPKGMTFAQCQARDSCDGGGSSGGGCYKYSHGHAAAGLAWK